METHNRLLMPLQIFGFGAAEADETKQEIEKVNLKPSYYTPYYCRLYGQGTDDD